jgi:hypothetical protein
MVYESKRACSSDLTLKASLEIGIMETIKLDPLRWNTKTVILADRCVLYSFYADRCFVCRFFKGTA